MNLTLAQLRLVTAVAETGSFTRAAERELLSQPALSRAIKDVERILAVRLFDRTTRSVTPTGDGREFLRVAEEILRTVDNGLARYAAYRDGRHGLVTVAALPSLAACVMPYACGRFAKDRPGTQVRILEAHAAGVLEHLRSGRADIGLTETPADPEGLAIRQLGSDDMVAVAPLDHPVTRRSAITWAELAAYPVVALAPGASLRRRADLAWQQSGVTPNLTFVAETVPTVLTMVAAGLGVAALTRSVLALAANAAVHTTRLTEPHVSHSLAVVARTIPSLPPPAAAFLAVLEQVTFNPEDQRAPVVSNAALNHTR